MSQSSVASYRWIRRRRRRRRNKFTNLFNIQYISNFLNIAIKNEPKYKINFMQKLL
jgi:hypothetical protein